jgi:Bacterial Ig domain
VSRIAGPHALALTALATLACGGNDLVLPTETGPAAAISMVKGDDQTGIPGIPLADSLVVLVTDSAGNPVPNQQVVFTVASAVSGAAVTPQSVLTGPDGKAGARWILGQETGTQEVVAQVIGPTLPANLEVRFTASATATPPSVERLALRIQPPGTVTAGVQFERQPVIQIRDAEGNDLSRSGVLVTAAVVSGDGTLTGTTTRVSDSDGQVAFTDLGITGGTGRHVLIFAADGFTSVSSDPVQVQPAGEPPPPPGTNQPPVAADDEYNTIEGANNTLRVDAGNGLLQNDTDPNGDELEARRETEAPNGRVRVDRDGSFTYTPVPNFYGDDRFTYRVEDESGASSTATVTVHVAPVNDSPHFRIADGRVEVSRGQTTRTVSGFVRDITPGADNESDQVLTFEVVDNSNPSLFASGPTVTRDGQGDTGTLRFTPAEGQTGSARITLVLRDNGGTANGGYDTSLTPQSFTIEVR